MKGHCVWITGLPSSGKTTLARTIAQSWAQLHPIVLDGDVVRKWVTPHLGFSEEDRRENVLTVAKMAKLLVEEGHIAIVAMVSPIEQDRQDARTILGGYSTLVYLDQGRGNLWPGTWYEQPQGAEIHVSQVLSFSDTVELVQRFLPCEYFQMVTQGNRR